MSNHPPIGLLPCPFCGGKAEIHFNTASCSIKKYGENRYWPICTNVLCPASGRYRSNEKRAIKAWNTRNTRNIDGLIDTLMKYRKILCGQEHKVNTRCLYHDTVNTCIGLVQHHFGAEP